VSERNIILIGGKPGSGKSRLGSNLAEYLRRDHISIEHLSIGDRIRQIGSRAVSSVHQEYIIDHLNSSKPHMLMESEVVYDIAYAYSDEHIETDILLVDGYPRTKDQVENVFDLAGFQTRIIKGMLHTVANDTVAMERLLKRTDKRTIDMTTAYERIQSHKKTFTPVLKTLISLDVPVRDINTEGDKNITLGQGLAHFNQFIYEPPTEKKHAS
jgi:adenylate kinase family enzyme